jgi:hypothetical protein
MIVVSEPHKEIVGGGSNAKHINGVHLAHFFSDTMCSAEATGMQNRAYLNTRMF